MMYNAYHSLYKRKGYNLEPVDTCDDPNFVHFTHNSI